MFNVPKVLQKQSKTELAGGCQWLQERSLIVCLLFCSRVEFLPPAYLII